MARCGRATFYQGLLNLAVTDCALLVGIGHDGAEIAKGKVWQLRHEQRRLSAGRQSNTPGYERPEPGKTLQQNGFPDSGRSADQQCVAGLEAHVERSDELRTVGSPYLDTVDVQRAVGRAGRLHLAERAGARVFLDQPVEADHRRAIACELVVGLPKERQRVVDCGEGGRRLDDVAE